MQYEHQTELSNIYFLKASGKMKEEIGEGKHCVKYKSQFWVIIFYVSLTEEWGMELKKGNQYLS